MLEFLMSNLATIIVSILLLAIVGLIVRKLVRDRKKGKNTCGCGCKDCPSASLCHPPSANKTQK